MTCQSCEIIIERSLKKIDGIEKISVSSKKHTLEIEGEKTFSQSDINPYLKEHGYKIVKHIHQLFVLCDKCQ